MVKAVLLDDNQSNYVFKHVEGSSYIPNLFTKACPHYRNTKTNICFVVLKTGTNTTEAQNGDKMVEYYREDDIKLEFPYYMEIHEFLRKFEIIDAQA